MTAVGDDSCCAGRRYSGLGLTPKYGRAQVYCAGSRCVYGNVVRGALRFDVLHHKEFTVLLLSLAWRQGLYNH